MHLSQATALLQSPALQIPHQTWADLGAGTGTFTLALASLLLPPGKIYAVDQDARALQQMPANYNDIIIETKAADFIKNDLLFTDLDGILMANALHYVKDKIGLINKLKNYIKEDGCFIIIEYETDNANPWVPYPIRYQALAQLFSEMGFESVEKLGEMPSRYQGKMYAALIR